MTTPAYSNVSSAFPSIGYYTQFDPYFYTVDNRPLYNLAGADNVLGVGVDAASRASLIEALGKAAAYKDLYGASSFITGLELTNPSANVVRVDIGALYTPLAISSSDTRVVLKQAILATYLDIAIPAPLTVGQSITYLIEGLYVDFGVSTSGTFPFFDAANTHLPSTIFNGELQVRAIAGAAATTGTQTPPSATSGWLPLYTITMDYAGTAFYNASYAAGSPASRGLPRTDITPLNLTTTTGVVGDTSTTAFADAATQGAVVKLPIHPSTSALNPYKPVSVKIDFSPSVTGGAFAVRLKYQVLSDASLLTPVSYVIGTIENISVTAAANGLASYTFSTVVPGYLLVGKRIVNLVIERLGGDGTDTNTGVLNLINTTVYQ